MTVTLKPRSGSKRSVELTLSQSLAAGKTVTVRPRLSAYRRGGAEARAAQEARSHGGCAGHGDPERRTGGRLHEAPERDGLKSGHPAGLVGMRPMVRRLTLLLALFLLTGGVAQAAEPPNQNDPCCEGGPQHLRHQRRGVLPQLPLRDPLVRRLPRGGRRRDRRHVLHRPAVLVPVEVVRLRGALGGRPQEQGRRRGLGDEPAPDEPRAVALRALRTTPPSRPR